MWGRQLRPLGNFPQLLSLQLRLKGYGTLAASAWCRLPPISSSPHHTTTPPHNAQPTRSALQTTTKKRPARRTRRTYRRVSYQGTCAWARGTISVAGPASVGRASPGHPAEAGVIHCLVFHLTQTQNCAGLCRRVNNTRTTHQRNTMGILIACPGMCANLYLVCVG